MKKVRLSDEAYRRLEEYRKQLSEELGREVSHTEALARLLTNVYKPHEVYCLGEDNNAGREAAKPR